MLTISNSREKMKIPANVVDQLVTGAQSDIRQVLNMLSTWKLSSDTMDFDEGKSLYVFSLMPFMGYSRPNDIRQGEDECKVHDHVSFRYHL